MKFSLSNQRHPIRRIWELNRWFQTKFKAWESALKLNWEEVKQSNWSKEFFTQTTLYFLFLTLLKPKRNAHSWRSIDLNDESWKNELLIDLKLQLKWIIDEIKELIL